MDKGEGEEDISSILNNFNLKMSKIADPVGKPVDHMEKTASLRSCSDEIFGGANHGSQHGVINRGGNSFASVLQAKSNKKVVTIESYFQIPIDPRDQEKTTFTCPYGRFAYRRMPFGLCNAPGTFQRQRMLSKVWTDTNLCLNWEKSHFMVKEGIVLGHKISKKGIEVDKAKIDVIAKLPHPTTVKGVWSFLGHAGFYQRFIKDFSKISRPMTHLLEKNTPFIFSDESKWAEAQALPTNDGRVVITFLKKLFCHFRMPKALISNQGTHFYNKMMKKTMKRYGVSHRFSTSYHPQTSGQVENTNRALKRILEKTVKDNPTIWSRKLDDALWAFLTAYKTPTGTTPYKIVYGKNYHLSFEIKHCAYWALKNCNPDLIVAGEK
ncbi:reverse transcriptase domain-containing protein [Tanacetum coccineum]